MNRLIIIGASGHGKVVADIAVRNGYQDIVFLDDNERTKTCAGFPVVGSSMNAPAGDIFVAIGEAKDRKRLMEYYQDRLIPTLIHPNATVAPNAEIGAGTVVTAGAVINPSAKIGSGCIINTCSSVDHDCVVSDYVHVAVGAHLCGAVTVGKGTMIGAGATVINNVNVCEDCIIGAGAVVIHNIKMPGIYIGVPAEIKTKNRVLQK